MSFFTPLPSFLLRCLCLPRARYSVRRGGSNESSPASDDRSPPPSRAASLSARTCARPGRSAQSGLRNGPGLHRVRGGARAPRRRARRHRRRTPTGAPRTVPDRAASERSSSVLRTSSTSQGESGPKQPPSTTAWTSSTLKVDARAMPEPAAGVGERAEDAGGAALGAADDLVREAPRTARRRRDTGRARNRLLADERLDAAAASARARASRGVDRHVAELPAEPVRAPEQAAAEHDPTAHPDLAEDTDEVVDPDRGAGPVLRERSEIRLVLDVDRAARAAPRARPRPAGPTSRGSGRRRPCRTPPRPARAPRPTRRRDAGPPLPPRRALPARPWRGGRARARATTRGCRGTRGARSEPRRSCPRPRPRGSPR